MSYGLGLTITKQLVEMMQGRIEVESEQGQGSTFTVIFPRVRDEGPPDELADEAGEPPLARLQQARTLIVEDNRDTAFLLKNLMQDCCEVTMASNAGEALRAAREAQYNLVLLDINLGEGASGKDVVQALRSMPAYQEVPIVALTAYALPGDRERFVRMGFNTYLSKPFDVDELIALTAQLLPQ